MPCRAWCLLDTFRVAGELGIDIGAAGAKTTEFYNLPARAGAVEIIEGASAEEKAQQLAEKLLEDKVL